MLRPDFTRPSDETHSILHMAAFRPAHRCQLLCPARRRVHHERRGMQHRLAEGAAGIRRGGRRRQEFPALATVVEPRRTAAEPPSGDLRGLFGTARNPARATDAAHAGSLPGDLRTARCGGSQAGDPADAPGIRRTSRSERPHRPAQRSAERLRRKPGLRLFRPLGRSDRRDLPLCGVHRRRSDARRPGSPGSRPMSGNFSAECSRTENPFRPPSGRTWPAR